MATRRTKGEGAIYRRDDGLWIGAVDLGWKNGKRVRKVLNGRTRNEVVAKMREVKLAVEQGVTLAPDRLTVEAYLEGWLTKRIPGTISTRTEALYARAVHDYINPTLGKIRLTKLTPTDVAEMLQDLEARGYSASTRRMARATLRRALRMAEQDGLLSRNVAAIAEGPKMNHREGRSLTPEQARMFLLAASEHRLSAAYVLTLSLGLRRGEILGLKWEDIEAAEGTVVLHIRRQLIRDSNGVHLDDLKTKGSRRTLHLSRSMIEMLDQHRAFQEAEELVKGRQWHNDHDLIFTSTIGTPLDPEQFGKTVPKIAIEAGLGHWSIHELRHSCASIMIAMDVPLEVIAEQLGHASIRVTKDVYGHLMPRSRARAAAAMQAALFDENVHSRPQQTDPLATQLATFDADFITPKPVTRGFVGRPGLDPGTLGGGEDGPPMSVDVRLSWSEDCENPLTSTNVPLNLLLRLSSWLSLQGFEMGEMSLR